MSEAPRHRYTARVRRDDNFWLIYVPELDQHTQARHDGEIEFMGRDLIAITYDVEPDSFDLDIVRE